MSEEVYLRLREFMDGLPSGFPATENGVELRILEKFFTPEEAEMVMHLTPLPEPVPAIAQRAGMEAAKAAEMLESIASRGNIFRIRAGDQVLYMAMSFLPGIYEFHLKSMDRELAELFHAYAPYIARAWAELKIKPKRVIPVEAAVEAEKEVATYDRVREMVRGYTDIAVADCICRVERGLLGRECERPLETCLVFGPFATAYYVENGIGRRISVKECLEILDKAEEAALVLYPSNSEDIINICCCCSCCCNELRALKMHERPADQVLSTYMATIDPDLCTACGICLERCQMEALIEGEECVEVNAARCIGCGLCASTCPDDAVRMELKTNAGGPPANILEMNRKMLKERGLA